MLFYNPYSFNFVSEMPPFFLGTKMLTVGSGHGEVGIGGGSPRLLEKPLCVPSFWSLKRSL